jgi:maltooligosyltrehalose trehalohydrolase
MPVAAFPGRFGWGYDGVDLFAPTQLYGAPDDFRAFVDAAHRRGLGVILDVVYNHFGPDGNYLRRFAEAYFTHAHTTEWGDAINFDGPDAGPVREFFVANARYWIEEFHLDGLRLDATQSIFDDSPTHILAEIAEAARDAGHRGGRSTWLVAENEPQRAELARPRTAGGLGLDALWNDDFHHTAVVALTGRDEAYYSDYRGSAREFVAAAKYGFLFQGQRFLWQKKPRGTPALDLPPTAFVHFLENHDQVANSVRGERLMQLTSPGRARALTALLLLGPQTPLLFQGQEFGATAPFLYFADHAGELGALVRRGRAEFLMQFPSIAEPDVRDTLADPGDPATFTRCRLDWRERERHRPVVELHRDLIALRREDPALRGRLDAAVIGEHACLLRWFGGDDGDRLLCVNLGGALHLRPLPEPLLAPPAGARWSDRWSSEDPAYGGRGAPPVDAAQEGWRLAGESAVLLASVPATATTEDDADRRA